MTDKPKINPHRRLPAINWSCVVELDGREQIAEVCLAFDPKTGFAREVAITGLGKSGTHLDLVLHQISIGLSRMLQWRDPDTGKPVKDAIRLHPIES
jgi:hypothetical protein